MKQHFPANSVYFLSPLLFQLILVPHWTALSMSSCTPTMDCRLFQRCVLICGGRSTSLRGSWFSLSWQSSRPAVVLFGRVRFLRGGCISRFFIWFLWLSSSQISTFRLTTRRRPRGGKSIRMALQPLWTGTQTAFLPLRTMWNKENKGRIEDQTEKPFW